MCHACVGARGVCPSSSVRPTTCRYLIVGPDGSKRVLSEAEEDAEARVRPLRPLALATLTLAHVSAAGRPPSPSTQRYENDYMAKAAAVVETVSKSWSSEATMELSQRVTDELAAWERRARKEEVERADAIQKALSELQDGAQRNSRPFFSVLVADVSQAACRVGGSRQAALHELTVWRASDAESTHISEGRAFRVVRLCVGDRRDGDGGLPPGDHRGQVRLSTGRATRFQPLTLPAHVQLPFEPRRRALVADLHQLRQPADELHSLVDLCVALLFISSSGAGSGGRVWSHLFVCDESGQVAVVEILDPSTKLGAANCKLHTTLSIRDLRCVAASSVRPPLPPEP